MKAAPRVSVVITAHNAAESVGDCLLSLKLQKGIAKDEIEILLVDDRSTDGTIKAARSAGLSNLRILRIEDHKPGGLTARQIAWIWLSKKHEGILFFYSTPMAKRRRIGSAIPWRISKKTVRMPLPVRWNFVLAKGGWENCRPLTPYSILGYVAS